MRIVHSKTRPGSPEGSSGLKATLSNSRSLTTNLLKSWIRPWCHLKEDISAVSEAGLRLNCGVPMEHCALQALRDPIRPDTNPIQINLLHHSSSNLPHTVKTFQLVLLDKKLRTLCVEVSHHTERFVRRLIWTKRGCGMFDQGAMTWKSKVFRTPMYTFDHTYLQVKTNPGVWRHEKSKFLATFWKNSHLKTNWVNLMQHCLKGHSHHGTNYPFECNGKWIAILSVSPL